MLVLLDESLPRQLSIELSEFDCRTVVQQKWAGLANGELLRKAASEGMQVFIVPAIPAIKILFRAFPK